MSNSMASPPVRPVRLAPLDLLGLGLLGIRTRTTRAVLSALGISIGIATLIVAIGIPASSQRALMNQLSALGTNMLRAEPAPNQKPPVLLPKTAVGMVARIGPVTGASAVANTHATVHRSDRVGADDYSALSVLATRSNLLTALNGTVRSGRSLGASTENFPTAVLGSVAATRLDLGRSTSSGVASAESASPSTRSWQSCRTSTSSWFPSINSDPARRSEPPTTTPSANSSPTGMLLGDCPAPDASSVSRRMRN
ncbi:ABC transporter permease [Streptomyces mirabilis]|uniref:ABC transporter permease n=1 Tax=Streptomyces mirabilis TaxID=68239 RepID=UPI0036DB13DE